MATIEGRVMWITHRDQTLGYINKETDWTPEDAEDILTIFDELIKRGEEFERRPDLDEFYQRSGIGPFLECGSFLRYDHPLREHKLHNLGCAFVHRFYNNKCTYCRMCGSKKMIWGDDVCGECPRWKWYYTMCLDQIMSILIGMDFIKYGLTH